MDKTIKPKSYFRCWQVWAMALSLFYGTESLAGPRRDWDLSSTFVCYYGDDLHSLGTRFDIVIIESRNFSRDQIDALKSNRIWVLGYVSLGEERIISPGATYY